MIRRGPEVELRSRIGAGAVEAVDHGLERDAARRVSLRIEEHLDIADVVRGDARE